jgi:Spy/CpxP family protein refolding chaperone
MLVVSLSRPLFSFGSDFLDHMDKLKLLRYFAGQDLFDGRIILRFSEKINLTDKQLAQTESLFLAFEEVSIAKNAEIKIMELRLTSQLKAKKTDRKAVEKLLRDIGKNKTDLFIAYLNYLFDLRDVLTPEQIETLREMKSQFKDHMRRRREPSSRERKEI